MIPKGITYSYSLALGRVPKASSRCITESKRLRSRPDSRDRRARCSGDHECRCWMPKHASELISTPVAAAFSSLDLRPIRREDVWARGYRGPKIREPQM